MNLDQSLVRAVVRKELREYRRNSLIVLTMALVPVIFLIAPLISVLTVSATAPTSTVKNAVGAALLFLLVIPASVPSVIASYSVVGERDQGTLEPLLTAPIRRAELLLGKGLAVMLPSVAITYSLMAIFYITVHIAATQAVISAVWQAPLVLAELLFAPLLAGWSIWIGLAISARANDVRVAQQLGTLVSLPMLGLPVLIEFRVVQPTVLTAFAFGAGLLLIDIAASRFAARMFDRERLILGRPTKRATTPAKVLDDDARP
jgi:ABC-type Na+ efflux pump permease subunit